MIRWLIIVVTALGCAAPTAAPRCPQRVEVIRMWTYQATVERVVDGDTLDLDIDLGFRIHSRQRVRLHGVDTPEIHGVRHDSEEYAQGMAARDFVERWIDEHGGAFGDGPTAESVVRIRSYDGGQPRAGKYGRWLVDVFSLREDFSLNQALLAAGHAQPYDGGTR